MVRRASGVPPAPVACNAHSFALADASQNLIATIDAQLAAEDGATRSKTHRGAWGALASRRGQWRDRWDCHLFDGGPRGGTTSTASHERPARSAFRGAPKPRPVARRI